MSRRGRFRSLRVAGRQGELFWGSVAAFKPCMEYRSRPRRFAKAIRSSNVIGSSTWRTLCSKRCGRSCASHSARVSASDLRPWATPLRISAIDTTLMNERLSWSRSSHSRTLRSGDGFGQDSYRATAHSRRSRGSSRRRARSSSAPRSGEPSGTPEACLCAPSCAAISRDDNDARLAVPGDRLGYRSCARDDFRQPFFGSGDGPGSIVIGCG